MMTEATEREITGFEKIRQFYYTYYAFMTKYPKLAQLVNKRIYGNDETGLNSPFYKKFVALDHTLLEAHRQAYVQGKEDGSIRADLDINLLAFSAIYIFVGFFQLFSFSGDIYTKHFGFELDTFATFSIERLLEPIRPIERE